MSLNTDISTALHLLEHIQDRVDDPKFCDDPKLQLHTSQDLKSLISLLEDPIFRSIVNIQDSLAELNNQLCQHPSILPGDFDISPSGLLELSVPTTAVQSVGQNMYQDLYQDSSEFDDQRVPIVPLLNSSSEDTSAQVTSPSLGSEVIGMPPITTPTYAKEFQKVIEAAAKGRQVCTVQLYKSEGTSLGFSVVGLRNKDRGELGIFLQEIQPNGIAGSDGRLLEGDQILAIDGQPLDSNISHEQAISILQKARGLVELIVARSAQDIGSSLPTDELSGASSSTVAAGGAASVIVGGNQNYSDKEQTVSASSAGTSIPGKSSLPNTGATAVSVASATSPATITPTSVTSAPLPGGFVIERSPSAVSDASKSVTDMVLNTEWAQVEVINLINDGSGLGFGIIGGKSTGVVVKTILPGGVADRDNRLQSGDHILQIGDVNLRGMGSEQVAAVLRQSGTHVRLVVARPVEPTSPDYQALGSHAPIVPTKILGDAEELDRYLVHSVPETYNIRHIQSDSRYDNGMYTQESDTDMHARPSLITDVVRNPINSTPIISSVQGSVQIPADLPLLSMDPIDVNTLPEMERFTVELKKDIYGLGITIAGYVCEKEELSGIFVKSISEGSAADLSNKIQINDRIVEVNNHSLQGYSNHEAVEVLRNTGQTVVLCLERYLRGPKYEQLQQAIAASELRLPQPSSPSITSLPTFPISADGDTTTEIEAEGESHTTVDSAVLQEVDRVNLMVDFRETNVEALLSDPSSPLTPQIEAAIKAKWQKIVGPDIEIVVAQLKKFAEGSGLGISLEGTVDVENGQEVRPHHYIRSILPEGPVGQNGALRSGDELLEVNGYRLLGINHMEVVSVLKELPIHVRMVCGRNVTSSQDPLCPIDTAQHQAAFQTRSILGGSLQNLLPSMDRLVKAKSDGSLASTTTTATVTDASLNKMKSRSLEPLTGLAMWSSEPQIIELVKGERGLGFSILDYQDPMNPNETVIVIRSLVPGGVAQVDGQLIPGDRLLFVNDIALENATLDQAVQALKGAPKGTVRIGVAKPLPIPDSIAQRLTPICMVRRSRSFPNEYVNVHAGELEDILSSRLGIAGIPTKKLDQANHQNGDGDEKLLVPKVSTDSTSVKLIGDKQPRESMVQDNDKDPITDVDKESVKRAKQSVAKVQRIGLEPCDSMVVGFQETVLKVKKPRQSEADASYEQVPSLIKLTPFEKEKRALIREPADNSNAKFDVAVSVSVESMTRDSESEEEDDSTYVQSFGSPLKVISEPSESVKVSEPLVEVLQLPVISCIVEGAEKDLAVPGLQRKSSMKKDHDSGKPPQTTFDDAKKKTVRIQDENEEGVLQEKVSEGGMVDTTAFEKAQLVRAKIISTDEVIAEKTKKAEEESQKISEGRTRLQIPVLLKSTSESTLMTAKKEENKISEKNIKPEILLNLSQVSPVDGLEEVLDEESSFGMSPTIQRKKRRLSRVSSDSARLVSETPRSFDYRDSEFRALAEKAVSGTVDAKQERRSDKPTSPSPSPSTSSLPVLFSIGDSSINQQKSQEATTRLFDRSRQRRKSTEDSTSSRKHQHLRRTQSANKIVQGESESETPDRGIRQFLVRKEEPPPVKDEVERLEVKDGDCPTESDPHFPAHHHHDRHYHYWEKHQRHRAEKQQHDEASGGKPVDVGSTFGIIDEDSLIGKKHSVKYQQQSLESDSLDVLHKDTEKKENRQRAPRLDRGIQDPPTSPRKEVQTQTQGEHKSTQYSLKDLSTPDGSSSRGLKKSVGFADETYFGSPKREVEVQTEQECKAVQCESDISLELPVTGSPRREAEVQTCQVNKGTQYREGDNPASTSGEVDRSTLLSDKFPVIFVVSGKEDMTVTHRDKDGNVVWAKHWGPERLVEIYREPRTSLGLSIVGGKIDLQDSNESRSQNVSGIFIKNVLPNSPAGRTGELKIGDRIIEVDGIDLRNSTHERAVEAIQAAGNPVCLLVQSLVHLSPEDESQMQGRGRDDNDESGIGGENDNTYRAGGRRESGRNHVPLSGVAPGTPTSFFRQKSDQELTQEDNQGAQSGFRKQSMKISDGSGPSARRSSMKKSIRKKAPSPPSASAAPNAGMIREASEEKEDLPTKAEKKKYSSEESSEEEDTRHLEGNVYTKAGMEISRKSAGNVKRSKQEIEADPEQEDEYGYTKNKIKKKYAQFGNDVLLVTLEKNRRGLGISLAGHKDRNKMAVFICGLNPKGIAFKNGELRVGDEILEVNGNVLQGRCHLNASAIIKGMAGNNFKIIVLRKQSGINNTAVKEVTHFPPSLDDEAIYNQYKGVRVISVKKGQYGLGLMIIEGKHAEVGQGIFISDIQEGSAAEIAGLQVGDMILAVNMDCLLGSTYEEATNLLKKAEGVVTLTVCNPNQSKVAKEEEDRAKGILPKEEASKEPEKPKEPEPPADPKDCKIAVGKETTIEFSKDKDKAIGFSVIGGSDTPLNGVFVLDVYPDGAAGKDGRLQPGDRIIDICKENFKTMEQEKAHLAILKIVQGPIIMIVYRAENPTEEFEVEIQKKAGKGSGLCLTAFKSGKGAYISEVVPGGSAAETGKILRGDRVVSVCGQDLRDAPIEDIALHIKVSNPVQLKLARYKNTKK